MQLLKIIPNHSDECQFSFLINKEDPLEEILVQTGADVILHSSYRIPKRLIKYLEPQLSLPNTLRKWRFDLIHYLSHEDAAIYSHNPFIVTVHDTLRLTTHKFIRPQHPVQKFKDSIIRSVSNRIIKRARFIITDSENSKLDILKNYDLSTDNLRVVYLGVDKEYFKEFPYPDLEKIRNKYQLPSEYLLYVGGIDGRKNIPNLLRAISLLQSDRQQSPPLVFAGRITNQKEYPQIIELCEKYALGKKIIFTGYIPEAELPLIFRAASAFVFPSLYEGFGLPVLQSMAAGIPVITANLSSIPELGGDAVHYIDPYDPHSIMAGIRTVLENREYREILKAKGRERAKIFSWEKTARDTIKVYLEVINRIRSRIKPDNQ